MKHFKSVFTSLFLLLFSFGIHAQSKTGVAYFEGKWSVLVKGLPQGDAKLVLVMDKKDSTLTGVVQDSSGIEIAKIDKVELSDSSATVYFVAQGYDVNLVMDKKDNDHITGRMMNMFDAEGERIKATK